VSGIAFGAAIHAIHGIRVTPPSIESSLRIPLITLVTCGAVVALRRWPLPVFGVAATFNVIGLAQGNASIAAGVTLGVATYFLADRLPRRLSIQVAAFSAVMLCLAIVFSGIFTSGLTPSATVCVQGLLPFAAAWFIGDSTAARRRYLEGVAAQERREREAEAERARHAVRDERVRIARELHDVVAHTLAVITVQAGVGRRLMAKRPEEASEALASIEMIGRTAQDELRTVLGLLREEEVPAAPLVPAPRLIDLKELAETVRGLGIAVELRTSGTDRTLSPSLELSLYRLVQEALTNVVKHAPGSRATVDVEVGVDFVRVQIVDDGRLELRGAARGEIPANAEGHGLIGMSERVSAFGGTLTAQPLEQGGFRVVGLIPFAGSA
jgi:signal transduction histidine kinase